MLGEVGPVVAAGIKMEFMRDAAGEEKLLECFDAAIEAIVVGGAAVEINAQVVRAGMSADDGERALAGPIGGIEGRAEGGAEKTRDGDFLSAGDVGARRILDECGAVRADGAEEVGIEKCEAEGPVASHGDAGDGAVTLVAKNAVMTFDEGQKFADEEVLVADAAVSGVDVEGAAGAGRDDEEVGDLAVLPEVLDHVEAAGIDEELRVAAETVEEVEDRIATGFVRVVGGREDHAVGNGVAEDFAGGFATFGAALSAGRGSGAKREHEKNDRRRHEARAERDPSAAWPTAALLRMTSRPRRGATHNGGPRRG